MEQTLQLGVVFDPLLALLEYINTIFLPRLNRFLVWARKTLTQFPVCGQYNVIHLEPLCTVVWIGGLELHNTVAEFWGMLLDFSQPLASLQESQYHIDEYQHRDTHQTTWNYNQRCFLIPCNMFGCWRVGEH